MAETEKASGRMSLGHDDILRWIRAFAAEVEANKEQLTQLDSAIGDGDHGINMQRGMSAVLGKVDAGEESDIGALLKTVGMTLVSTVGGAGGPLYGTLFMQMGMAVSGKEELSPDDWAAALEAAVTGVQARGKAEPGDKTMIDALIPGRDALKAALAEGATFEDALRQSADAADQGMRDTVPLVARKGRASYLGERSAGHQDPGATSSHLLLEAAAETWGRPGQAR
ncbi:MAG TPA: dihydroxyacetone kinase subunit DhaL [Solirubrobacterales bacterium]|nr:dihydroxyacetone kinase subunit DhaL [Solirubrobacterales bacterium]